MGGSTTVQAPSTPDPSTTYSNVLGAQIQLAPEQFAAESQYAPQYAQLYQNIIAQNLPGLLQTYSQAAPQIQKIENATTTQQLQGNLSNLQNLGGSAVSAFTQANPNLASVQNQLVNNATSFQGTGMITGLQNPLNSLSDWGQAQYRAPQASLTTAANTPAVNGATLGWNVQNPLGVSSYGNNTLGQLNQTAQQQLALGGNLGKSEQDQIANNTLSYFNTMGRGSDPIAAANLALNLDSAQQARLAQREQMAGTAAGLNQAQSAQGLQAQQANQAAQLQAQGLGLTAAQTQAGYNQQSALANQQAGLATNLANAGYAQQTNLANLQAQQAAQQANQQAFLAQQGMTLQGATTAQQQALQAALANQQAQLSNYGMGYNLLSGANSALMGTTMPALGTVLSPSTAFSGVGSLYNQSAATPTQSTGFNYLNSGNQLYGDYYSALNNANVASANNTAGLWGGAMSGAGALLGGMFCWVAREVYGKDNPRWLIFRHWMLNLAPAWFRYLYCRHGEKFAAWLHRNEWAKPPIKRFMDGRIESLIGGTY